MPVDDIATATAASLDIGVEEFQRRVREEAEDLKSAVHDGTFDHPQAIVGLEYEFYAVVDDAGAVEPDGALMRVPRRVLDYIGFEKELGMHNAEMSTSPQPLNEHGLAAQEAEIAARLRAAQAEVGVERMRLISDGMWTIPPAGATTAEYLTDSVEYEGITIATNLSPDPRYHALSNSPQGELAGKRLEGPHVSLSADTVMPQSLITSIQPHFQVPIAENLPTYFRYALRVAAPLLALGVNSPLYPPDLYDEDATAERILADARMESRIDVFETTMNDPGGESKVRFPADVETVDEAIDRIVEDPPQALTDVERGTRFDHRFAHLGHKRGTYWRWVRPVFEGATPSEANARVEFRPLPAQPTIRDTIAFQAAFAGLLRHMATADHPAARLDWQVAHDNFYAAVRDGLDAELVWITAGGTETSRTDEIYDDLFAAAMDGLRARGLSESTAKEYLQPLRYRATHRRTPARWKLDRVRRAIEDGTDFEEAVYRAQRRYFDRQRETLFRGSFVDWPAPGRA